MHWRLIIEEFNPELIYIKGERNLVADALSRLDIEPSTVLEEYPGGVSGPNPTTTEETLWTHEYYGHTKDDLPFPLRFKNIQQAQSEDRALQEKCLSNDKYKVDTYR